MDVTLDAYSLTMFIVSLLVFESKYLVLVPAGGIPANVAE